MAVSNPFEKKSKEITIVTESSKLETESIEALPVIEELPKEIIKEEVVKEVVKETKSVKSVKPVFNNQTNLSRKQQILAKFGGLESNVPLNSAYWHLKG